MAGAGAWLALTTLGGARLASAKVPAQAGKLFVTLEKGKGDAGVAIYDFVGDLRYQFSFVDLKLPKNPDALRGPAEIRPATLAEIKALGLQPEPAVRKALSNMGTMWPDPPTAAALIAS